MRLIVMLCLSMVLMALPVAAQDDPNICGELATDDCSLLTNSQKTMTALDAAAFDINIELNAGLLFLNIPFVFSTDITGDYVLNDNYRAVSTNAVQLLTNTITGITSDVNVIITLPEQLNNLGMDIPDEPITFDLRLVDGVGYANLVKVIETTEPTAWYGIDIIAYYNEIFDLLDISATSPFTLPEDNTGTIGAIVQLGGEFSRQEDPDGFLIIEGIVTGDQILADEDLREEIELALQLTLEQQYGAFYDADELQDAAIAYTDLLQYIDIRTQRRIDPETAYLHGLSVAFNFLPDEDASNLLNQSNDPIGMSALVDFSVSFTFDLEISQFNAVDPTSTPETYELIPLDEMLPDGFNPGSGV